MTKSVLLLSGGMDSAVSLGVLKAQGDDCHCIFVDYGQHPIIEWEYASELASFYSVSMQAVECRGMLLKSKLIQNEGQDLESVNEMTYQSISGSGYVPSRNNLLIAIAGCIAESLEYDRVVLGSIGEVTDSDQSLSFIDYVSNSFNWSKTKVKVDTVLRDVTRGRDVVNKAVSLRVPLDLSYSCYRGGLIHCGRCEACIKRILCFKALNIIDPVDFETEIVWPYQSKTYAEAIS